MVRFRRDPADRNNTRSQRFLLGIVACLLAGQNASGQVFSPGTGTMAAPNSVFNASPDFYKPQPAFGPNGALQQDLLPVYGDQEPGALQNVSYSQPVGEYGTMNVYGSPDADNYSAGAAFSINPSAWLYFRDLQAAVYTNTGQTVVNAGTTFSLWSNETWAVGGRALLGATVDHNLQDEIHFSGDAFAGFRLPGEIWLKGGFMYDGQDSFYKYGPTFAAVFRGDAAHPITLDAAYGIGQGDVRVNQDRTGLLAIADHDLQVRLGTYLSPMMQLGVTGMWARWDNEFFKNDTGIGGFARMSIADLEITVDVTDGDLGTRGFVNVAYVFGGPQRKSWREPAACGYVDRPEDWLTRPVIRDTSLRVQQVLGLNLPGVRPPFVPPVPPINPPGQTPLVGNITQVACSVQVNPLFDQFNPGVVDPGDGFNLIVTLGNGTAVQATNILITNITTNVNFLVFSTPSSEVVSYHAHENCRNIGLPRDL
jgi:hypothetical protein